MRTVCLTLTNKKYGKTAPHHDRARAHFTERGVGDVLWFYGLDAARLGVDSTLSKIGPMPTGCFLSHRAAWAAVMLMPSDEPTFFLEDDANFPDDWRPRFDRALADVERGDPEWEILYPGSCCTADHFPYQTHLAGEVVKIESQSPQCLHAYIVRSRRALMSLCERVDALGTLEPIDGVLARSVLQHLRTYVVLPRIVSQFDTVLSP
jgi:hypothetical protein